MNVDPHQLVVTVIIASLLIGLILIFRLRQYILARKSRKPKYAGSVGRSRRAWVGWIGLALAVLAVFLMVAGSVLIVNAFIANTHCGTDSDPTCDQQPWDGIYFLAAGISYFVVRSMIRRKAPKDTPALEEELPMTDQEQEQITDQEQEQIMEDRRKIAEMYNTWKSGGKDAVQKLLEKRQQEAAQPAATKIQDKQESE